MMTVAGVAGYDSLQVKDDTTTYPTGRKAGFLISQPNAALSLGLLGNNV